MATDAPVPMPTEEQALILAQWFSPAYPVGGFAYSHGLEQAVHAGRVSCGESLADWLTDVLSHGSGQSDARFLAAAGRAADATALHEVETMCRAFAPSRERLLETRLQGAAFCDVTSRVWGLDLADLSYPVAVGQAARLLGLPLALTARLYLLAFAGNLVSAAQRLLPLGQGAAQEILHRLHPLIGEIAERASGQGLEGLSSIAILGDICAMQHEIQEPRIFRT